MAKDIIAELGEPISDGSTTKDESPDNGS